MCACASLTNGTNYKIVLRLSGRQQRSKHKYIKTDFEYLFSLLFDFIVWIRARSLSLAAVLAVSLGIFETIDCPAASDGQHFMTLLRLLVDLDICAHGIYRVVECKRTYSYLTLSTEKPTKQNSNVFSVEPTRPRRAQTNHRETVPELTFQNFHVSFRLVDGRCLRCRR